MAISLPDARQLSDEALQVLRLRALRGVELGYTETDLAQLLGVCRETISRWWSAYAADGLDALPQKRTGHPPGSGRCSPMSKPAASSNSSTTTPPKPWALTMRCGPAGHPRSHPPRDRRQPGGANRPGLPATLGLYLEEATSPCPQAGSRRTGRVAGKDLSRDRATRSEEDAEILWCDETGVEADHHPGCGYAHREGTVGDGGAGPPHPGEPDFGDQQRGDVAFMTYKGTLDATLFLVFLGRLLQSTSGKLFVIVDRLRAHDTQAVWDWVDRHRTIALFYLPRYFSGKKNPAEYLNNDLKGNVNEPDYRTTSQPCGHKCKPS